MGDLKRMAVLLRAKLLACLPLAVNFSTAENVEFNRDIRPILTKNCTACHGGVKEAGGVSFVFREKALAEAESGNAPIVPGKPEVSEMMRRIRSTDPDDVMPQPKHGPPLAKTEIALIEQWISQGAAWQEHWSFVPPSEPSMPVVVHKDWPNMPMDHHVLSLLEKEKLLPSPEASPAEWLRRVSLDLTGLPPSPEELTTFENAVAQDPKAAREAVVDRLLESPRFGERWATVWLDLARYSDTYGFEKDPHRDIWPYRDWVIDAFNADMPYDQFTIEQLAGDLLPNPSASQKLATAFHRNTQTNTEGGTDDEEFRVAAVIDRVSTTWTTWQATTFGCVQCHAHPYDPIDHDEFYQFKAFFDSSEDHDLDDDFPRMRLAHDPARRDEAADLENRILLERRALNDEGRHMMEKLAEWTPFMPSEMAPSHGKLTVDSKGVILADGTFPVGNAHVIRGAADDFTALRLTILPDSDDPAQWPERGSLITQLDITHIDATGARVPVPFREIIADHLSGNSQPNTRGNIGDYPKLHGPRTYVLIPTNPMSFQGNGKLEISMKHGKSTTGNQGTPVRRFRVDLSSQAEWNTWGREPERQSRRDSLAAMQKTLDSIPATLVPVMQEREPSGKRDTRVFARGNRLTKEQSVDPGVPALLASNKTQKPGNRLEMARWLVDGENPLTARVMVNRLWAELFGIGIVETQEDFGTSGTKPSNQDLLDHLALRFQSTHHWSVKATLREIVLSSTYRQTHRATPEMVARDPDNRLLARGPRNRLSAEMIRDQALAVGGLLSAKIHGASVFPPQPAGVWNSVYSGASWKESKGEDRYRRGVYTYSKRTSGFPGFLSFDAPSRDICSPRRLRSNTPLQALVTLNDPAHIEAAQAFAKRMSTHATDLRAQLAHGVLLATQMTADNRMLDELVSLHADASKFYQETTPADVSKLADTPTAAALVLTANTILNLDSALTK